MDKLGGWHLLEPPFNFCVDSSMASVSLVSGSGRGLDALRRGYLTTSKNRSQR